MTDDNAPNCYGGQGAHEMQRRETDDGYRWVCSICGTMYCCAFGVPACPDDNLDSCPVCGDRVGRPDRRELSW